MTVECLLDNCPHHAAQRGPLRIMGTVCQLKACAWDSPTITGYLDAVRNPEDDDSLFIDAANIAMRRKVNE